MGHEHLELIDSALLSISVARERAERTARALRREGGDGELARVLEEADRGLLALHGELMRAAYFPAAAESQLELAASR